MDEKQAAQLGRFLRTRREHLGLSTRQLAARCAINDASIVRIEQGRFAAPRPDKLSRLAAALGLSLADVFALADYVVPAELPALGPYLRAKYRDLPDEAVDAIDAYTRRLAKRHGVDVDRPEPGADDAQRFTNSPVKPSGPKGRG